MKSKKVLFVVHRYAPFPGGSEIYVQNMAEEMQHRGHKVAVFSSTPQGDHNGIKVYNDPNRVFDNWDLIVVHGGDCPAQNFVHFNAALLKSPVLYLIIKPSLSAHCANGLLKHRFLGYSSFVDRDFLKKLGNDITKKARRIRHGVTVSPFDIIARGPSDPREFVSAGGFWPHKKFEELKTVFLKANLGNAKLHLFGYDEKSTGKAPTEVWKGSGTPNGVRVWKDTKQTYVHNAMVVAGMSNGAYIMNSSEEGFGLVLLESMLLKCPWIARNVGGVSDLAEYGTIYETEEQLTEILKSYTIDHEKVSKAYEYAMANHTIQATANDIESILIELSPYDQIILS